jgi:hypothetical protein
MSEGDEYYFTFNTGEKTIAEKIDNVTIYFYVCIEFDNDTKYVSQPFITEEEANRFKTKKYLESNNIKKSAIIKATEAQIFKFYNPLDSIKIV